MTDSRDATSAEKVMAEGKVAGYPAIVASAATLVRDRRPTTGEAIRETIDAVAAAGFSGMSIWTDQHDWAVTDDMTSVEFFDYHRSRGLQIPAAEVVFLDAAKAHGRADIDVAHSHLLDVSAAAGARTVIAVVPDPGDNLSGRSDAGLGHLCDLAADRGLNVSFEFLPWSAVPDLASAIHLVEAVDRDNLGFVIDTWHWFRQPGGPALPVLRSLPADRIDIVQLNDAPVVPSGDLVDESQHRLLPGEGAIDILGLLAELDDIGARPVIVSEVFSSLLTALGPTENARLQFEATQAIVTQNRTHRTDSPRG
jgi:sugar phosphate isomerase/epimerase